MQIDVATTDQADVAIDPAGNPVPMIWTAKGNLPLSELEYRSGWQDETGAPAVLAKDPAAVVFWEEHWHRGEMVRRSAHAIMREGVTASALAASLG